MATPPTPTPPPLRLSLVDLVDELIEEILIRIPPYRVSQLVRCSAVCKRWRRILTDPTFLGRYRAFHRVPPMLGFLFNTYSHVGFTSTTGFRPRTLNHADMYAMDSRHGRVILQPRDGYDVEILVWDPVTDERREVPGAPVSLYDWGAAVLCAAAAPASGRECDHLDCHGGHFLVVVVGLTIDEGTFCACVYSSEDATWSVATCPEDIDEDRIDTLDMRPSISALVGNTINFMTIGMDTIVECDLGRRQLAFIDPPFVSDEDDHAVLMPAAGGGLGFAAVLQNCLHLYSREVGAGGIAAWNLRRVIGINTPPTGGPLCRLSIVGFAEGLDTIFVRTDVGVFEIELESYKTTKVSSMEKKGIVIPYMSFYTPDRSTG